MRRIVVILGTLLITMVIIISGSAVAAWRYVSVIDWTYCTNIYSIQGSPDIYDATLGENHPINPALDKYGEVRLNLSAYPMPPNQVFTVFAGGSALSENYDVFVGEDLVNLTLVGLNYDDQSNHNFTTPNWGSSFPYIILVGKSGYRYGSDTITGPEINAVGWDEGT